MNLPQIGRLRRLIRPTIGRKFTLLFAAVLIIWVASGLVVDRALDRLDGFATQINLSGSLRWLARDIEAETHRFAMMRFGNRDAIEARLQRAGEVRALLRRGGNDGDAAVRPLPAPLQPRLAELEAEWLLYDEEVRAVLGDAGRGEDTAARERDLRRASLRLLAGADRLTGALARQVEEVRGEVRGTLLRMALVYGAFMLLGLFGLRYQIVRPVRQLAAASERIAQGRYDERLGYAGSDEIGQLAGAFDRMAERIGQDLREKDEDNRRLREAQHRLQMLSRAVEHSPVCVVITDSNAIIEYVNPKFVESTGFAAEEVIGQQPSIQKSGRMPAAFFADMWATLKSGREWRGQILNRKKNGELIWEDTWIAPVMDEENRIRHYVAVKEDITERRRIEEERAQLNEMLERRVAHRTTQLSTMVKELETFSYSVSHDLRSPLRGIHGFASLMSESCAQCENAEALGHLERIRRASVRMGDIIDDLLDLSRISRSQLRPGTVDLSAIAHAVLAALAERDPARAVTVDVEPDMVVPGDAGLLRVVLENLLGNAWKFSAGAEHARIGVSQRREAGETVVCVRDNGAGFDMRYADKLFLPFQRLHKPGEFEGSGIGLATVKKVISLHGGRLWAESAPGRGAAFFFALPLKPSNGIL